MIEGIGVVVAFLALAVLAFVASVRLGMLVGLRLDRALEASETEGATEGATEGETEGPQKPISVGIRGQEEYRGE